MFWFVELHITTFTFIDGYSGFLGLPNHDSCNISAHTLFIPYAYTHMHTYIQTDIALTTWQTETRTVGRPQTEQTVSDVR